MSPESILDISNDKFFNSFALISVSFLVWMPKSTLSVLHHMNLLQYKCLNSLLLLLSNPSAILFIIETLAL